MISLPPYVKGIIVGLILSDAWLILAHSRAKNSRLGLQQSFSHFGYFWAPPYSATWRSRPRGDFATVQRTDAKWTYRADPSL
jgi:hypothetical protein